MWRKRLSPSYAGVKIEVTTRRSHCASHSSRKGQYVLVRFEIERKRARRLQPFDSN